jgi:rubredoxin
MSDSGFCISCGFMIDSFEGLNKCPNCGYEEGLWKEVPFDSVLDDKEDSVD